MPKLKTVRGAAKRLKRTAHGFKFRRCNRSHILTKKSAKRKRQLRRNALVGPQDYRHVSKYVKRLRGGEGSMARVKRGVTARARHKKILKKAKGYYGARSRQFKIAKQTVIKAGQYAYRDRKVRKRAFRALWIARINAAARACGMPYSRFMAGLIKSNLQIDRKILADIAVHDMPAFQKIAEQIKAHIPA